MNGQTERVFSIYLTKCIARGIERQKTKELSLSVSLMMTYLGGQTWMALSLLMLLRLVCTECVILVLKFA